MKFTYFFFSFTHSLNKSLIYTHFARFFLFILRKLLRNHLRKAYQSHSTLQLERYFHLVLQYHEKYADFPFILSRKTIDLLFIDYVQTQLSIPSEFIFISFPIVNLLLHLKVSIHRLIQQIYECKYLLCGC